MYMYIHSYMHNEIVTLRRDSKAKQGYLYARLDTLVHYSGYFLVMRKMFVFMAEHQNSTQGKQGG